jgi:integrase
MGVRIIERKPGQWWVYVAHKYNRVAKLAGSRETAEAAKRIIEDQLRLGLFQFPKREPRKPKEPPKPTVREYFKVFDETHLKLLAESYRDNFATSMKTHIIPLFGDVGIDEVKLEDIERLIAAMRDLKRKDGSPKIARGTIDRTMREVRAFFNHAIEHGVIAACPVPRPKKLNPIFKAAPSRREEIDPLEEDEVTVFLDTIRNDSFSKKHLPLFLTLIYAGLRIGEALALEWSDIDWRKRELVVRYTWDRDHKKLRPPKSGKVRRVPICHDLYDSLQAHRRAKVEEWMARKAAVRQVLIRKNLWNDIEHTPRPVFCSEDGGRLDADNILRRHFKRCLRKAGIRERAQHDLRHTFASLHLGNGTPIAFVSDWMGHSTIELTVKRYGHLEPKKGRDWINSLPGLMPQNLQQGCNKAESRAVGAVVNFSASGRDFSGSSGAGDGDRTRDVQPGNTPPDRS